MYNLDDKHPIRPGFEPSTSEFRATTGSNAQSGPAVLSVRGASLDAWDLTSIDADTDV